MKDNSILRLFQEVLKRIKYKLKLTYNDAIIRDFCLCLYGVFQIFCIRYLFKIEHCLDDLKCF